MSRRMNRHEIHLRQFFCVFGARAGFARNSSTILLLTEQFSQKGSSTQQKRAREYEFRATVRYCQRERARSSLRIHLTRCKQRAKRKSSQEYTLLLEYYFKNIQTMYI